MTSSFEWLGVWKTLLSYSTRSLRNGLTLRPGIHCPRSKASAGVQDSASVSRQTATAEIMVLLSIVPPSTLASSTARSSKAPCGEESMGVRHPGTKEFPFTSFVQQIGPSIEEGPSTSTAGSSFLRAGSQRTDRGQKPAPREPERATRPTEASGPGEAREARIERLSNQGDPASRGELPTKPRERRLDRRQQRGWVGAKAGGDVATQAAR